MSASLHCGCAGLSKLKFVQSRTQSFAFTSTQIIAVREIWLSKLILENEIIPMALQGRI